MKKGISPVIATVILVAVTLVIAVAIVGWLFGLWGGLAGGSPSIQITNLKFTSSKEKWSLELYIRNTGGGSDKILKIEIFNGTWSAVSEPEKGSVIPANFAGWMTFTFETITSGTETTNSGLTVPAGTTLTVKIYFEKSGTQTFTVTAS